MRVDALRIWRELDAECGVAVGHYSHSNTHKDRILARGAADFDEKCSPDDDRELAHYRTDYYVSRHGYMEMHLKQNLDALENCFENGIPQPLLFVDFGCGPMTAGLALAEMLSRQTPRYKTQTAYFGVDVSRNMVVKARAINEKYGLFAPERFKVVENARFDPRHLPRSWLEPGVAVLYLSFVLAPNTLKGGVDAAKLADDWRRYVENRPGCEETRIIYLNPLRSPPELDFHANWRSFEEHLRRKSGGGGFCYTLAKCIELRVNTVKNPIFLQTIHGTRN